MNLLRLLSAGRSLVGLKDSTARYRMSDPKAMPKFGSGSNPFWAKRELQGKAEPRAPLPSAAPACRSERETESAAKDEFSGIAAPLSLEWPGGARTYRICVAD